MSPHEPSWPSACSQPRQVQRRLPSRRRGPTVAAAARVIGCNVKTIRRHAARNHQFQCDLRTAELSARSVAENVRRAAGSHSRRGLAPRTLRPQPLRQTPSGPLEFRAGRRSLHPADRGRAADDRRPGRPPASLHRPDRGRGGGGPRSPAANASRRRARLVHHPIHRRARTPRLPRNAPRLVSARWSSSRARTASKGASRGTPFSTHASQNPTARTSAPFPRETAIQHSSPVSFVPFAAIFRTWHESPKIPKHVICPAPTRSTPN